MLMPAFPFALWGRLNFIPSLCTLLLFLLFFAFGKIGFSNTQNGQMYELYSAEWNGSVFLFSGNGLSSQEFHTFNFYENNYYIFENNSSIQSTINIGENNNSIYSKSDVWNNGAYSEDEYILFQPDFNSSRIFYYFKPDSINSTGQINISAYDSSFLHPMIKKVSIFKFIFIILINASHKLSPSYHLSNKTL